MNTKRFTRIDRIGWIFDYEYNQYNKLPLLPQPAYFHKLTPDPTRKYWRNYFMQSSRFLPWCVKL